MGRITIASAKGKGRQTKIYHKIWNEHNPDNQIKPGDDNVVHHINGDPSDNRIKNLQKMNRIEHNRFHSTGRMCSKNTKHKMSEAQKGDKNHFYGKTHSKETKKKIGKASIGRLTSEETRKKISEKTKGENNPMHGIHLEFSQKRKKAISEKTKGKGNPMYGKKHSEATKRKISETKRKNAEKKKNNNTIK